MGFLVIVVPDFLVDAGDDRIADDLGQGQNGQPLEAMNEMARCFGRASQLVERAARALLWQNVPCDVHFAGPLGQDSVWFQKHDV